MEVPLHARTMGTNHMRTAGILDKLKVTETPSGDIAVAYSNVTKFDDQYIGTRIELKCGEAYGRSSRPHVCTSALQVLIETTIKQCNI